MGIIQFGFEVYSWLMHKPSKRGTRLSNHAVMLFLQRGFSCKWRRRCGISANASRITLDSVSASLLRQKWPYFGKNYTGFHFNSESLEHVTSKADLREITRKFKELCYCGLLAIEFQDDGVALMKQCHRNDSGRRNRQQRFA